MRSCTPLADTAIIMARLTGSLLQVLPARVLEGACEHRGQGHAAVDAARAAQAPQHCQLAVCAGVWSVRSRWHAREVWQDG